MAITTRTRIGTGIAALALATTGMAGVAAAETTSTTAAAKCPKGYFCVWPGFNYTGKMQKVSGNNANLAKFGGAFAKTVRSYHNNGSKCAVKVWNKKNYKGKSATYTKGMKNGKSAGVIRSNKWC